MKTHDIDRPNVPIGEEADEDIPGLVVDQRQLPREGGART